jgi:hypothetical protein
VEDGDAVADGRNVDENGEDVAGETADVDGADVEDGDAVADGRDVDGDGEDVAGETADVAWEKAEVDPEPGSYSIPN